MQQRTLLLTALAVAIFATLSCVNSASSKNSSDPQDIAEAPGPDEGGAAKGKLIDWKILPDNNYFMQNGNGAAYLYINLKSGENGKAKKRVPLNISLVLDRSGSMSGDKIAYAKKAAKFVISQLGADDIVSIVNYDDKVEVSAPSQKVRNKEALMRAIDQLYDRGSTNLTGGLLEGYTQVKSTMRPGYVNRVLLLTDGLANVGITNPDQIKRLVDKKYREEGIALSTFGLGADYNEDLLTMLAETGHANYYFIGQADKIPELFAGELKGLLNVVAQNASVSIKVPAGMNCEKVYGYPYELKDGNVVVRFNDVYANDEKAILIKFKTAYPAREDIKYSCELTYTDANEFNKVESEKSARMTLTNNRALIDRSKDAKVQEMIAMFETTERFDDIMTDVDNGRYEQAKQKAARAKDELKSNAAYSTSEKLQRQAASLDSYSTQMDSVATMREDEKKLYQKGNKSSNYMMKKNK